MLAHLNPYREPRCSGPEPRPLGLVEVGLRRSLLVLAGWTALRVATCILHGRPDGEGAMAALLLVGVLHALARSRLT
jgi:hypothetical protein